MFSKHLHVPVIGFCSCIELTTKYKLETVQVVAERPNVCKQLHMPAQSGSSVILHAMRRGYDREAYDALVARIRDAIPQVR